MTEVATPQIVLNPVQWADWKWRVSNLYWIIDENGQKIRFRPNPEQLDFIENIWYLNLILKARRLGFTTLIGIIGVDRGVFNSNQRIGFVGQTEDDASKLFRDKLKFAYNTLPDGIRQRVYPIADSTSELSLSNNSIIWSDISMRGHGLNFLHISEFGAICARRPDRAKEIVTGAMNTLTPGQYVTIESTAKGRGGYFFKYVMDALKAEKAGKMLTKLDFELHFYPWYLKKEHSIDPTGVVIDDEMSEYFNKLRDEHKIELSAGQKAWYVKKKEMMELDPENKEDMRAEFPSYPEEAFDVAIRGAIYSKQMSALRSKGHIGRVPHVETEPVNTFWDLGRNTTAIWFHQYIATEHRFIRYYEKAGEDLPYFYKYMQDLGYIWGRHFLPHDAENKNLENGQSRVDRLVELGIKHENIVVVERIENIDFGIEQTRKMFPLAWIDEQHCSEGIKMLDSYQHRYDEKLGTFMKTPLDNFASHGADAFRQWAQGWAPAPRKSGKKKPRPDWRQL